MKNSKDKNLSPIFAFYPKSLDKKNIHYNSYLKYSDNFDNIAYFSL